MLIIKTRPKSILCGILCLSSLSASLMKIRSKMKSLLSGHFPQYMSMRDKRTSDSHVNSPICPKIELVQDFIAVLITCKYDGNSIKNEIAIIQTTFLKSVGPSRVANSHANSRKWVQIKDVRDFLPFLVIYMFNEDSIKNEVAVVRTTFSPFMSRTD